jgi:hypothetical protein
MREVRGVRFSLSQIEARNSRTPTARSYLRSQTMKVASS